MKKTTECKLMKKRFEKLGLWLSSDDLTKLLNFVETGVIGQN